jgi:hypothetical protein
MSDKTVEGFFETCIDLIEKRSIDYADPAVNIKRISKAWSEYLQLPISSYDVCMLMTLLKLSRLCHGHHQDSIHDAASYLALAHTLAKAGVDHD